MLPKRCASICSRWTQRGELFRFARSATSPANRDLNLEELEQQAKSSANAEALFGIAPRKVRDGDDEDFTPSQVPAAAPSPASFSANQNYFSETWEKQRRIIMGATTFEKDDLEPYASPQFILHRMPARERVWQVALDADAVFHETFKFVSLKVLSTEVVLRHKFDLYCHAPSKIVDWNNRRKEVLKDLKKLSADIICLQEVDKFDDIHSDLSLEGYNGLYQGTTGTSRSGCATFWKQNRFKLLHEEGMDFFALRMRFKVAQLCVFQLIVPGTANDSLPSNEGIVNQKNLQNCILVGNMEALFNPNRGDIKLAQCRLFFERLHKLSCDWPGVPLLIGGCFHATPESYIYKFITESELDVYGLDYHFLSGHFTVEGQSSVLSAIRNKQQRDRPKKVSGKTPTKGYKHTLSSRLMADEDCKRTKDEGDESMFSATPTFLSDMSMSEESSKVINEEVGSIDKLTVPCNSLETKEGTNACLDSAEPSRTMVEPNVHVSEISVLASPDNEATESDCPISFDPDKKATGTSNATKGTSAESVTADHGWDPEVLKAVSGSDNCTVVRHDLKLFSVYPEVPGHFTTRDAKGEPCITMSHNEFKGTVDYIWRSEGLKTLKVLDTFSVDEFLLLPVIPFMASGSDHVSLACELAFCPCQKQP